MLDRACASVKIVMFLIFFYASHPLSRLVPHQGSFSASYRLLAYHSIIPNSSFTLEVNYRVIDSFS